MVHSKDINRVSGEWVRVGVVRAGVECEVVCVYTDINLMGRVWMEGSSITNKAFVSAN